MHNWLKYDLRPKTSEEGCECAKQLHRCVQASKLGNHWLVPMCVEVGAPGSNLQTARRVQHLADVCHQLVQMIIYTIQHILKHVCISLLECRIVNRGVHLRLYTRACETARQKRCVDWLVVLEDVITFEIELNVLMFCLSLHLWKLGGMPSL